jgi:uncharacterized tellurite resistance protein B-like protein
MDNFLFVFGPTGTFMTYQNILTNLYYLFIHADGKVNETEIAMGNQMACAEGIQLDEFKVQMVMLKSKDTTKVYGESLAELKKLEREHQVRCIAWLCVVANADGFMDRTEWQFIYGIYHKELRLSLDEIMAKQKELTRIPRSLTPLSSIPIL